MTNSSATSLDKIGQLAEANTLYARAQRAHESNRLIVAYRLFCQSIALFEGAGNWHDRSFKRQLADAYERCSYVAYRLHYRNRRRSNNDWCDLGNDWTQKSIDMNSQLLVSKKTPESINERFSQLLRMHRLAGELLAIGSFARAEAVTRDEMHLHRKLADDDTRDTLIWLESQNTLAQSVLAFGEPERAINIINRALQICEPDRVTHIRVLEAYASLCTLKSKLVKQPVPFEDLPAQSRAS